MQGKVHVRTQDLQQVVPAIIGSLDRVYRNSLAAECALEILDAAVDTDRFAGFLALSRGEALLHRLAATYEKNFSDRGQRIRKLCESCASRCAHTFEKFKTQRRFLEVQTLFISERESDLSFPNSPTADDISHRDSTARDAAAESSKLEGERQADFRKRQFYSNCARQKYQGTDV